MIYEHEIPDGCKLYFKESAKLKRKIETLASNMLTNLGYDEIVTPFLSYHQHISLNEKRLLRFSDFDNNIVSLRADSTIDVVRLVKKRLKAKANTKKWFYIQPVFRYPSTELYQIGAEHIASEDLKENLIMLGKFFHELNLNPILQISHIQIPTKLSKLLDFDINVFKEGRIEELLAKKEDWLEKLNSLQDTKEVKQLYDFVPDEIKSPLKEIYKLASDLTYENIVVAPLYYSRMRYYDRLFFRFIQENEILCSGGSYVFENEISNGFGIYTDAIIEKLIK